MAKKKIIINVFIVILLTIICGVAGRYLAGFLLVKSMHINYPLEFGTYDAISGALSGGSNKKTNFVLNAALAIQIIMIILIPVVSAIAILAKIFKKESRYGDAKWATNSQLKHFEDKGAYRK